MVFNIKERRVNINYLIKKNAISFVDMMMLSTISAAE